MFHVVMAIAIPVAVIWALVIFPSFRIVAGIALCLGLCLLYYIQKRDETREQIAIADSAKQQMTNEARMNAIERRNSERWTLVQPAEAVISSSSLTSKGAQAARYLIEARVKNASKMRITAIELEVLVQDCQVHRRPPPNSKTQIAHTSKRCEIVGQAREVFELSIPPDQTRGIRRELALPNLPQFQGDGSYLFKVTRVKANSPESTRLDDLLEEYGLTNDGSEGSSAGNMPEQQSEGQ